MMKRFYESNKDFRDYVDGHCRKYNEGRSITVEEALEHAQVRQAAEYFKEKENEENGIIESEVPKSGAD